MKAHVNFVPTENNGCENPKPTKDLSHLNFPTTWMPTLPKFLMIKCHKPTNDV